MTVKRGNPKDLAAAQKICLSCVPLPPLMEAAVALTEGERKYGKHNFRTAGVLASVYFDAAVRHLFAWWEGEDNDPDSGLSHITKVISTMLVFRDAMMSGNWTDDRPPRVEEQWLRNLQAKVDTVFEKYPDRKPPHTHLPILGSACD